MYKHTTVNGLPFINMLRYHIRRGCSVVVTPSLVFSSSATRFGSSLCDLRRNLVVSYMSGTDTTRNQYSFFNMSTLQNLLSTLLAKPLYTRGNHIRTTFHSEHICHPCMYLLPYVNWMDENAHSVHRAHNQLNRKCPSMVNTRHTDLRN